MEPKKRASKSSLSIFLVVIFILLTILGLSVVAFIYTSGKRPTTGGIVGTGNIRLISEPEENLKVEVDGNEIKLDNKLISNLSPGEHTLTVSADGYLDWSKQIQVEEGIVKSMFVRLIPEEVKLEKFLSLAVQNVYYSPDGEYIYYVISESTKGEDIGIWRRKIVKSSGIDSFLSNSEDSLKITNLNKTVEQGIKAGSYEIILSPDNDKLVLKVSTPDSEDEASPPITQTAHYILDADRYNEPSLSNQLEEKLTFGISEVKWLQDSDKLIIRSEKLIAAVDLSSFKSELIHFSQADGLVWGVSENRVYFYNGANQKLYQFENGETAEVKLENIEISGEITAITLPREDDNVIVYQTKKNSYFYLNLESSFQYQLPNTPVSTTEKVIRTLSADGLGLVYKNNQDKFVAVAIEELKSANTIRVNISELEFSSVDTTQKAIDDGEPENNELNDDVEVISQNTNINLESEQIAEIKYTSSNNNLLLITTNNNLYVADKDGSNINLILESKDAIKISEVQLTPEDEQIFVAKTDEKLSSKPTTVQTDSKKAKQKFIYFVTLKV